MPIRVTCPNPKCLKKFQVSEQFAGRKGPCPSCKKEITIPDPAKEKVVIHTPDTDVPKDSSGRSVLQPIFRQEVAISTVQIVAIVATVVTFLLVAIGIRFSVGSTVTNPLEYPYWPLVLGAIALGPPSVLAGYFFLKDEEIGSYQGKELWLRVSICGVIFALLWIAPVVTAYAFQWKYETVPLVIAVAVMFSIGGLVASGSLEFEFLMGMMVYCLYFGICVLMRLLISAQALPLEPTS